MPFMMNQHIMKEHVTVLEYEVEQTKELHLRYWFI